MRKFAAERDGWDGLGNRFWGLDLPVASGRLSVPTEIGIEKDRLVWTIRPPVREVAAPDDLLTAFLHLGRPASSDRDILAFAKRCGPLGFCEHDLPCTHNWSPAQQGDKACLPCHETRETVQFFWEPVATWRRIAARLSALLNIVAWLRAGKPSREEDWRVLLSFPLEQDPPPWKRPTTQQLQLISEWLNGALRLGLVGPQLETSPAGRYDLRLVSSGWPGLFGEVAIRAMLAVSGVEALPICFECHRAFMPKKRPARNRRAFCPDCGAKARARAASNDYYARKKTKARKRDAEKTRKH